MIRKEGNKWVLYTKDGSKKLGTFDSEEKAKERERQIQFFKHQKSEADGYSTVEMVITKATLQPDGSMRWQATVSDTDPDRTQERTSLTLFQDWIERATIGKSVDFLPPPRMPFLGISHYPALDGAGEAGITEKMFVDGKQFKASGVFLPTPVGQALFNAVRSELEMTRKGQAIENPIRISAAWWDLEHSHGNFVFTRRSLTDVCPLCTQGAGDKQYLKGQPDHWASTRVPIHPRTELGLEEKSMGKTTRHSDAASIVGKERADELEEKAQKPVGKSEAETTPALVVKANEELHLQAKAGNIEGLAKHMGKKHGADPGFFTACMADEELADYSEDQRAGICAQAHKLHLGYWPGEKKADVSEPDTQQMAMGMGEEMEYHPLGGAMSLADAESFIQTQQMMDKLYTNWDLFRTVVDNILSAPGEVDKPATLSKVVTEFGDRVSALKASIADAYLWQPIVRSETMADQTSTTSNAPVAVLGTAVQAALENKALTREAKAQAIQAALETYVGTVKAELDTVAPPAPGEAAAERIERSLGAFAEKLDLWLAKMGQAPASPPVVPQQKSYQPGTQPVLKAGPEAELPTSPITGKPSRLTALINRSVGMQ